MTIGEAHAIIRLCRAVAGERDHLGDRIAIERAAEDAEWLLARAQTALMAGPDPQALARAVHQRLAALDSTGAAP